MVELLESGIEESRVEVADHPAVEEFTPRVEELLRAQPLNPLRRMRIFELTSTSGVVAIGAS